MTSLPEALLSIDDNKDKCLLCDSKLETEKKQLLTNKGWLNFKENAKKWSEINFPFTDPYQHFNLVYEKVVEVEEAFGKVHTNCRLIFSTKVNLYEKRYGKFEKDDNEVVAVGSSSLSSSNTEEKFHRKSRRSSTDDKRKCFICFETRGCEMQPYNEGGLARCEMPQSHERLVLRSAIYSKSIEHRFHDASKRFEILRNGQSFDSFAIDIYYHKSCYIKFALNPISTNNKSCDEDDGIIAEVINDLYRIIRVKIIKNKEAYLLHQLHTYLKTLCEEYCVDQIHVHTVSLKRDLRKKFEDEIDFFPLGKYVLVHSSNMNPCEYSIATLKGKCLKSKDYVRSFGNFIRKKVEESVFDLLPDSPEEMIKSFDNGPLPELYNAIYATMYSNNFKTNEKGYAITNSRNISTKIWSIASDWQSLITRKETSKQAMLGLTIHRLTGSKEAVMNLNKFGHAISYNKICDYNNRWSKMVSPVHMRFILGVPLHSSIDNNDGRQETTTGTGTTHDTNMTLFQPLIPGEYNLKPQSLTNCLEVMPDDEAMHEIPEYSMGQRSEPPKLENYKDDTTDLLTLSFKKDLAWSIANGLPNNGTLELPLLGSWTAFQRKVSAHKQERSLIEYMPIICQPPGYDVCKHYLDNMNEVVNDLGLTHIFVHADEEVYARLAHVIWKHGELYKRVVILMGGFHQLRVKQRTIYKRHAIIGYKDWFVDSGIIASGSVEKAFGGFHYYRCMRILKESFDAMVQYRVEELSNNYTLLDEALKHELQNLRIHPTPELLDEIVSSESYELIYKQINTTKGTQGAMTLEYLKDVSNLLALVSSVRECNIERHLQAEREMIKHVFAFDHQNYSRYMSYQHVLLNNLKKNEADSFKDLETRGIGANYSGERFAAVHGDLVTEYFNRETKGTAGPFRQGFSTNIATKDKWVNTVHIHAKLRMVMRDKVNINTSSTHKELTDGAKKRHKEHVDSLKETLKSYGTNPFSDGPATNISTGAEIKVEIIDGLLNAPNVGNERYLQFVENRLIKKVESFYSPITRQNINTGMKKPKKTPRAISVLKEDVQAFGLLVQKAISMEEAFTYPLTSVPLSLAYPDGLLRQGSKANFRNYIIQECKSAQAETAPIGARWIYDGMALFRTIKPLKSYREWLVHIIKIINLQIANTGAIQIDIVNDQYLKNSIKSGTRSTRSDGANTQRVHIKSVDQKMLNGKDWEEFFHNDDNKTELLKLASSFYRSPDGRKLLKVPLVITCGDECWKITQQNVENLPSCNHEEADTRLILHAAMSNTPAVIVAKDTDVFILLAFAITKVNQLPAWYMKIDANHFIDMKMIFDSLGGELCTVLPQLHAITGCDTTSYKFNTGKVRCLKKVVKDPSSLSLIAQMGKEIKVTDGTERDAIKFVQTMLYNGKSSESYVDTRIRLYKNLKKKSSASIPADPDSLRHELARVHLQSFIWVNCLTAMIPPLDIYLYGWQLTNNVVAPIWFTGDQYPPSLTKKKSAAKEQTVDEVYEQSCDLNIENEATVPHHTRKRRRVDLIAEMKINDNSSSSDESLWESDFSSDYDSDSSDSDFLP